MQKFIDQAIFDSGILILSLVGIMEKKTNHKYDIERILNHQGMLDNYQRIRPNDHFYKKQTKEVLEWIINSNLIDFDIENFVALIRIAADVRMELNADMKPPNLKERIFRGAIFQPEPTSYLNRVNQAKLNINTIINQVSPLHQKISSGLPLFEKKLRASNLENFIFQTTNLIKRNFEEEWHKPTNKKVDFHLSNHIAASCFWSSLKRFNNFPVYIPVITPRILTEEITTALTRLYGSIINPALINNFFELYLSHAIDDIDKLNSNTEEDLWKRLAFEFDSSHLYSDENTEVLIFLEDIEEQLRICDPIRLLDINFSKIGFNFLNLH